MENEISVRYHINTKSKVSINFMNILGQIINGRGFEVETGDYIENFTNTFKDKIIIAKICINNECTTQKLINNNSY